MAPLAATHSTKLSVTSTGDSLVRVDMNPQSFRRVLYILVQNSLDWMVRTEGPTIGIHVHAVGDFCELTVSDNGPGISKAIVNRIFEPMFSTKEGARGMGLTIAQNLVEQHGGKVAVRRVSSAVGPTFACLFRVSVPAPPYIRTTEADDQARSVLCRPVLRSRRLLSRLPERREHDRSPPSTTTSSLREPTERNFAVLQRGCQPRVLSGDLGDIENIDLDSIVGGERPDILIGGPPCQGFSRVGRGKLDSLSPEGHAADERNRALPCVHGSCEALEAKGSRD